MNKTQILRGLATGVLFAAGVAHADSTVSVKGMVTSIPCTINDTVGITTDFGDVLTTRINGTSAYLHQIVTDLQCDSSVSPDTMLTLSISGTPAAFGEGLLASDKEGLGMQFKLGNDNFPVNTGKSFAYRNHDQSIALYVVPAKDDSVVLAGGPFTATATLTVDYQ